MGNRLSKIYTRQGDDGTTGLGDGSRIEKHAERVEVMGEIDELNSIIGLILVENLPNRVAQSLTDVQHMLFTIGGDLCIPGRESVNAECVDSLEYFLDFMNESLSPLKEFILPGGCRAAALCHQARTVCRRTERRLSRFLLSTEGLGIHLQYINRLSDLLFVMARYINQAENHNDVYWQSARLKS